MRSGSGFWNALAAARRSNLSAAGAPMPERGSPGMTRRRVIAAMAASAVLPLAACEPLPSLHKRSRVAIIGGGLAGLEALRRLREKGVDARLYEARGRLGGRVFTTRSGPVPADDGGQFINGDHGDVLDLARRHGLKLIDRQPMRGLTMPVTAEGRVIGEAELAEGLRGIAARIAADAEALDADYKAHAPILDALSVTQYLDNHADSLPQPWLRQLLEASIRTEFGQEPQQASALELVFNLPVSDGRHFEVIGASDERFVLEGGSGRLIAAMAPGLEPYIETGMALTGLAPAGDAVRLHFSRGETAEAERVIVTVPAPLMRTIDYGTMLPSLWRQYVSEIACGRNEKLNAAYRGRPWEKAMGVTGDIWPLAGGFAEGWDATTVTGGTGLFTYFMGGAQCDVLGTTDAASLRARFEAEAAPALPDLGKHSVRWQRRTRWSADPFARGAYSCFRPGQLTRFASLFWLEDDGRPAQIPRAGPIIFAGEHLSDAWPGYMNGGLQTGRLAAEALLGEP